MMLAMSMLSNHALLGEGDDVLLILADLVPYEIASQGQLFISTV
jgi:hypothetical protein